MDFDTVCFVLVWFFQNHFVSVNQRPVQGYLKFTVPHVQGTNGSLSNIHEAELISFTNQLCKLKLI